MHDARKKPVDHSEQLAEKYLLSLGRGPVVFEPDGNVTPDFSLNDNIGIEVRQLNQNFQQSDGSMKGLEEVANPLTQRMEALLLTLGESVNGESWYVHMEFCRPLGDQKRIRAKIKSTLLDFKRSPTRSQHCVNITPNFALELVRAPTHHGSFFLLGNVGDGDLGGWGSHEKVKNRRFCISEKEKKVQARRAKYSHWWLVLVDHIDFGREPDDRELFRREVLLDIHHSFHRIVILDPTERRRSFEVY
jgi:hypothetical protein